MHEDEVLFTEFFNQRLKERGYTLEELADETGIALKHLESFSHGRFEHLPSAPYVHGYFVRLGAILGFDPDEWWHRVREDEGVHRAGSGDRMPGVSGGQNRVRIMIAIGCVALVIALYAAARYTTILGEPRLTLSAPPADVTAVSIPVITFEGSVQNGDKLMIGGNPVPLRADGTFSAEVALSPGPNTIEIRAEKTLGRAVTLSRQIIYNATPALVPVSPTPFIPLLIPTSAPSTTSIPGISPAPTLTPRPTPAAATATPVR